MTQKDNGGPAFPSLHELGDIASSQGGMSMRDWFAGQALAGISTHQGSGCLTVDEIGIKSYAFADAMLAARGKP